MEALRYVLLGFDETKSEISKDVILSYEKAIIRTNKRTMLLRKSFLRILTDCSWFRDLTDNDFYS